MSTAHSELNSSTLGKKIFCIVCLFSSGADLCTVGALSYQPLHPMSKLGVFQDKLYYKEALKLQCFDVKRKFCVPGGEALEILSIALYKREG